MNKYILLEGEIPYDNDDYGVWCSFYYDVYEKKIVRSNYGHGMDDPYNGIHYQKAIEQGIITYDELVDAMIDHFQGCILYTQKASFIYEGKTICLPCEVKVKGSRKYRKPTGIAVRVFKEVSRYYPTKVFCEVLDPDTKQACNIRAGRVSIVTDSSLEQFRDWAKRSKYLGHLIHQLAYKASYYHCDALHFSDNWEMFVRMAASEGASERLAALGEYTNADNDAKAEKLRIRNQQLYDENIENVRKWAHEKFDGEKSEEEIEEIIDRTMKRHYTKS